MRSPDSGCSGSGLRRGLLAAAFSAALLALPCGAAMADPAAVAAGAAGGAAAAAAVSVLPARSQLEAILGELRADPDLQLLEHKRVLRLKQIEPPKDPEKPEDSSALRRFLRWMQAALSWIAEAGRWTIWLLLAAAVALLLVSARRWMRDRGDALADPLAQLPVRVGGFDVRPQSLPERIGAEARALWQRGEHRGALSLLYRGALSRLIHEYAVPIRSAHTEGECLQLARSRLRAEQGEFFGRLVRLWQLAVYGARLPESESVLALCDTFDLLLGRAPAQASDSAGRA